MSSSRVVDGIASDDGAGGDPQGVTLLTVHAARGLEWPVVLLAGLEDVSAVALGFGTSSRR
jgi:superfamily I DNA/RNA helicase